MTVPTPAIVNDNVLYHSLRWLVLNTSNAASRYNPMLPRRIGDLALFQTHLRREVR
jgi:hypothetical protein